MLDLRASARLLTGRQRAARFHALPIRHAEAQPSGAARQLLDHGLHRPTHGRGRGTHDGHQMGIHFRLIPLQALPEELMDEVQIGESPFEFSGRGVDLWLRIRLVNVWSREVAVQYPLLDGGFPLYLSFCS